MKKIKVSFPLPLPNVLPLDKCEDGRPVYMLEEDFACIINGNNFVIRAGIEFDYASIPRIFWSILLPNDPKYQAASLLHDVAYQAELWPREINDNIFLAALEHRNVPSWKRMVMYRAVRVGGGFTYKKHTHEKILAARQLLGFNQSDFKRPLFKNI